MADHPEATTTGVVGCARCHHAEQNHQAIGCMACPARGRCRRFIVQTVTVPAPADVGAGELAEDIRREVVPRDAVGCNLPRMELLRRALPYVESAARAPGAAERLVCGGTPDFKLADLTNSAAQPTVPDHDCSDLECPVCGRVNHSPATQPTDGELLDFLFQYAHEIVVRIPGGIHCIDNRDDIRAALAGRGKG